MTNLPQEATGATALSARWNVILNKLQNASDTDVRIRGRKLSAGTVVATTGSFSNISGSGYSIIQDEGVALTSRSTVDFVGTGVTVTDTGSKTQVSIPSGGAAAYYGERAESYITSGDGSAANPYNASAIQTAVDALPSRGGIVFIKEGIWYGTTRINVNGNGSNDNKKVIFIGAGTYPNQIYWDSSDNMLVGTHIKAGFDCYNPCDFYNMTISSPELDKATDGIAFTHDLNRTALQFHFTAGLTIENVKFKRCDTGIRFYGTNMGTTFLQIWGVRIERCGFIECNRGIRIHRDDADSTAPSQGFRGTIRDCEF